MEDELSKEESVTCTGRGRAGQGGLRQQVTATSLPFLGSSAVNTRPCLPWTLPRPRCEGFTHGGWEGGGGLLEACSPRAYRGGRLTAPRAAHYWYS